MTPDAKKALKRRLVIVLCAALAIAAVYFTAVLIYKGNTQRKYPSEYIDRGAVTVAERFRVPEGFVREDGGSDVSSEALKKFGLAAYYADGSRNFDAGPFNGHRRSGNFCAGRFDCKVQTMRVDSCKGLAMNKLPTRLDRVVRESNLWQRFRVAEFGSNQANPVPSRFFSVDERT